LPIIYDLASESLPPKVLALAKEPSLEHLQRYERTPDNTSIREIFYLIRRAFYAQRSAETAASDVRALINGVDHKLAHLLADKEQTNQGHILLMGARIFIYRSLREGTHRCLITKVLVERLRHQLRAQMDTMVSNQDYWHGLLWCLCVGASSTPESGEAWDFFSTNVGDIVEMAGVHRNGKLEEIMRRFLWDRGLLEEHLEVSLPILFPSLS